MFNGAVLICTEPRACQKQFACIAESFITSKSLTAKFIKERLFWEFVQTITCVFHSFIVHEVSSDGHFRYQFLSLHLVLIALFSCLVKNGP